MEEKKTYSIKIKKGEFEFEVTGDKDFVESKFDEFKEDIKKTPVIKQPKVIMQPPETRTTEIPKTSVSQDFNGSPNEILAEKLGISTDEVDQIVHFTEDAPLLVRVPPKANTRAKRQAKAVLMLAYAFKYALKHPKLTSDKLSLACKNSGVEIDHMENAFTRLNSKRWLIKEKKGSKFNILTPQGDAEAVKVFKEDGQ